MDEKNRMGLFFIVVGSIAGIFSALMTKTLPMPLLLIIVIGFFYGASYMTQLINVDMEAYGGRRKVLQTGFFSFLQGWIVLWFIVYEAAKLYA